MRIVCATDGHYLPHCVAMLNSLWQHNQDQDLEVYLVADTTDSQQLAIAVNYLHGLLPSISVLQPSAKPLQGFPVNGHATIATYFRLLLPELLPAAVDRVIFIDADTIVASDLSPLWNLPLQSKALAAVPEHRLSCQDHGYVYGEYFNAGIMLIDLHKWRQSNVLERGRRFANEYPDRLRHWDQDVLNHVFEHDWLPLPDRWNACPHLFGLTGGYDLSDDSLTAQERLAVSDPAIIHFAGSGSVKPWNARCRHPLRSHYLDAKAATPWSSTPLADEPPPKWKQALTSAIFRSKCALRQIWPRSH